MLLHVVCCAVTSGEKVDISCNVIFVGYCVVNLDGTSCVYANVFANGCVVVLLQRSTPRAVTHVLV